MDISSPGGHLDQLIRQTRQHHTQLSAMADVKANMLITLASLVITFSLRYFTDELLRWPILIMIGFCIATIFSAAYAVMPKVNFQYRPNLENVTCNLLFFGNFMNLEYDEFAEAMDKILNDPSSTYEAQVREVYELGVFLGRKKYPYIRRAYMFFISGLIVSGLTLLLIESIRLFNGG
jgi:hypothetical protein